MYAAAECACAEEYDAELEHMNTTMAQENQNLQHDNKQLNALIKEYEQTLETLMSECPAPRRYSAADGLQARSGTELCASPAISNVRR